MLVLVLACSLSNESAADSPKTTPAGQNSSTYCSLVKSAFGKASKIRKLKIKSQVPCKIQNRDQVRAYLQQAVTKKVPAEKIRSEGVAYQLLGLVPPGYDYLNSLIELYTHEIGGYYEPDENYYAMVDWLPAEMQMTIAIHELTHALQDQHYDLSQLMDEEHASSDTLLARSALAEGDATAVMIDADLRDEGEPPLAKQEGVSEYLAENIAGAMMSEGMRKTPRAVQALMLFPYVSGLNFTHELLKMGGYAKVDSAYKKLPNSTTEILHPERYLSGTFRAVPVLAAKLPARLGWDGSAPIFEDTLGEFIISTMLSEAVSGQVAAEAAAGWVGDRVALYSRPGGEFALAWKIEWESVAEAEEFALAMKSYLEKRCVGESKTEGKSEAAASKPAVSKPVVFEEIDSDGRHFHCRLEANGELSLLLKDTNSVFTARISSRP